mgnify:FL=1
MPRSAKPRKRQPPEGAQAASELLRVLLKMVVEQQNVAAKVIATSDDLERIAAEGEDADVPAFSGWRKEIFGDQALKLLRGEVALRFVDRTVTLIDLPKDA